MEKQRHFRWRVVTFSSANSRMKQDEQFLPVPGTTVYVDDTDNWANAHSATDCEY